MRVRREYKREVIKDILVNFCLKDIIIFVLFYEGVCVCVCGFVFLLF